MWSSRTSTIPPVTGDIDSVLTLGLRRHYAAALSAARWVELCNDPSYGHQKLVSAVGSALPQVAEYIIGSRPERALHLASLGPGDGSLDTEVVRVFGIARHLASFTGIDLSFELLRRAIRRIAKSTSVGPQIPVTGLWGDFTEIAATQLLESMPGDKLFLLTGFTLGNYEEATLLRSIRGLMRSGDHLLLDARLRAPSEVKAPAELSPADRADLIRPYDSPAVQRFVFSPVELATLATTGEVTFNYDITQTLTVVPNALNIVISCGPMDTVMRASGTRIQRDRIDLAVTTVYGFEDLVAWFASAGFQVAWSQRTEGIGVFLVRVTDALND
jgi:hypothetical protein